MKKILIFALFVGLIGTALGADCNNPLLTIFNLTKLSNPSNVTGLKYCKTLQKGTSCCSADVVNSIQTKANELLDRLKTNVAARDKLTVNTRDVIIPGARSSIEQLKTLCANTTTTVNQIITVVGKTVQNVSQASMGSNTQIYSPTTNVTTNNGTKTSTNTTKLYLIADIADELTTSFDKILNSLAAVKSDFNGYQKARTVCVVQMAKLQASAYCLACDPNYATKGVSAGGSIPLSNTVCTRLQASCFDFFSRADSQSQILVVNEVVNSLTSLIDGFTKVITSGSSTDMDNLINLRQQTRSNTGQSNRAGEMPPNCTAVGSCPWICSNLFKNGKVDEDILATGRKPADTMIASRLLQEVEEEPVVEGSTVQRLLANRKLQAAEWDVDEDEAGVDVAFADDPAGVKNGLEIIKLSLISMVAFIAILMV